MRKLCMYASRVAAAVVIFPVLPMIFVMYLAEKIEEHEWGAWVSTLLDKADALLEWGARGSVPPA